ncbi:peroxidase family protein [Nitrospira sp. NS4]|uniref:peroxidase family protein n=1 Tax=Nitrospira sp. NS4 TaxID=3414498 RepID=UPI003C2D11C9
MIRAQQSSTVLPWIFRLINRVWPWHKLPFIKSRIHLLAALSPQVLNLPMLRHDLRRWNLHDTRTLPTVAEPPACPFHERDLTARREDGTHNDLADPAMGRAGARFGRNLPLDRGWPDTRRLMTPNPREVSLRLMTRRQFTPATSLNLLAAAWIQFQVHDWIRHEVSEEEFHDVPLRPDDVWPNAEDRRNPMKVRKTRPDGTRPGGCMAGPPTFRNLETHWWDASQLYGSSKKRCDALRLHRDGLMRMEVAGEHHVLPQETDPLLPGVDLTGMNDNYWVGLSLLHTLFTREHNAIAARLQRDYPDWTDEQLFQKARLINAALIAKIHTVEWTPGILARPSMQIAMNGNWWGGIGERLHHMLEPVGENEAIWGIPGTPTDHHGASYSLTEEFTSVYRLHPLIPDEYRFSSLTDPSMAIYRDFAEVQGNGTRPVILHPEIGMDHALYSFGLMHPGAITLGNFPRGLQHYKRIKPLQGQAEFLDLAALDILRDRERGVPRYNDFRRMLRMKPVTSFKALNAEWADEMAALYGGDIELVDTQVGLFAEQPPAGFGFSDTAFRIFILMASRRLKSDRFFTKDYRPEVYTPAGMDWIRENTLTSVLLRHHPQLAPALAGSANPFAPWRNVHSPALPLS